jgi:arylsulfatase A-like enzyme
VGCGQSLIDIAAHLTQAPIEGVSFAYTFNQADAPTQHQTRYYAMFGHRSIYHDGWRAVCPWLLTSMTLASAETTDLDPAAQILVRFAALVALDAAPASYLFHFGAGADQGLTAEDAQQVLVTLAPLVGSARIVSASSKIARALGFALAVAEAEAESDADSM